MISYFTIFLNLNDNYKLFKIPSIHYTFVLTFPYKFYEIMPLFDYIENNFHSLFYYLMDQRFLIDYS